MKKLAMIFILLACVCFGQSKLTTNEATIITVGPMVDSLDGITPETAIDVTTLTIEGYLENDAGTVPVRAFSFVPTASGGSNDMALITSSVSGVYSCELTAAQLNITGRLRITVVDTDSATITAVPWWRNYLMTIANVVDSEAGSDSLDTQVAGMDNDVITAAVIQTNALTSDELDNTFSDELLGRLDNLFLSDIGAGKPAEPGSMSVLTYWGYGYSSLFNKTETTAGEYRFFRRDESTIMFEHDIEDNGTTFTKDEAGAED